MQQKRLAKERLKNNTVNTEPSLTCQKNSFSELINILNKTTDSILEKINTFATNPSNQCNADKNKHIKVLEKELGRDNGFIKKTQDT